MTENYQCGPTTGDLALNDCVTRDSGERYCICVGEKCNDGDIEAFVLAALLRAGSGISASATASLVFGLSAAVIIARNLNAHHIMR